MRVEYEDSINLMKLISTKISTKISTEISPKNTINKFLKIHNGPIDCQGVIFESDMSLILDYLEQNSNVTDVRYPTGITDIERILQISYITHLSISMDLSPIMLQRLVDSASHLKFLGLTTFLEPQLVDIILQSANIKKLICLKLGISENKQEQIDQIFSLPIPNLGISFRSQDPIKFYALQTIDRKTLLIANVQNDQSVSNLADIIRFVNVEEFTFITPIKHESISTLCAEIAKSQYIKYVGFPPVGIRSNMSYAAFLLLLESGLQKIDITTLTMPDYYSDKFVIDSQRLLSSNYNILDFSDTTLNKIASPYITRNHRCQWKRVHASLLNFTLIMHAISTLLDSYLINNIHTLAYHEPTDELTHPAKATALISSIRRSICKTTNL